MAYAASLALTLSI